MGEHPPLTFTARGHLIARWDPLCGLERLDIVSASGNACTCQNPPRSDRFGCIRTDSICPSLPSREQPCCSRRGSFYREWGDASSFFSLREGFFFALLLIFPFRQEKSGAQTRIKEACHKIYIAIRRNGDFFTGRSKKHTTCGSMKQKKSPATSRIGGCPKRPCRRGKQRDEKALLRLLEAFLPQDPGAGCEAAQDSGRDPQPGTAFFPKKAGGDFPQQEKPPPLSSTSY